MGRRQILYEREGTPMIKEVIVVEGKDDIRAVKAALDAEVIPTNGYAYGKKLIKTLQNISKRRGIIILTDPDYVGERIRRDISSKIENCKHAYLPQGKAIKKDDIGVENASKDDIIEAISKARPNKIQKKIIFTKTDMLKYGLSGGEDSSQKRDKLGHVLGIGYANSKQFLKRLNNFGISKEEFEEALERINKNDKK